MDNSEQRGTPSADFPEHDPEGKPRPWLRQPNSHSQNDLTIFRKQLLDTKRYPEEQFEAAKSIENELRIFQDDTVVCLKEEYLPMSEKLQDRLEKEAADGKINDEIYRIAMTHLGALNKKIEDPRRFEQNRSSQSPPLAEIISPESFIDHLSEESSTRETTEQQDWGHDAQPRSRQGTPEINVSQATDVQAGSESESDPNHSSREQSPFDVMSGREVETIHQQTGLPSWDHDNTVAGLEAENELGPRHSEQDRSLQAPSSAELMSSSSLSIGQSTEQQDWGHDAQPRSLQGTPEIYVSQATYVEAGDATEFDPNHSSWEQSPVNVMSGREADISQQADLPSDGEHDNTATGLNAENELGPRQSSQDRSDSNHINESSTPNRLKRSSSEPAPPAKRPMLERDFTSRDFEREDRGRSR